MFLLREPGVHRTCTGLRRRELLQVGAVGAMGFSLADAPRARAASPQPDREVRCIFLFLWGGPPQHELWDPKPDAPAEVAGPVKPIETSVSGIRIGELLPRMARLAHRYTLVRSATHEADIHGNGAHCAQTGSHKGPTIEHPNMGAVVGRYLGGHGALPPFVTVGPYMIDNPVPNTGQEGGFLGNVHQPFRILDPLAPVEQQPALSPPPGLTVARLTRRDALFRELDRLQARVERVAESDATRGHNAAYERAFALATSPSARAAFDLEREPAALRDRYGRGSFGQSCLMARRLIESGVRYVQVNWSDHPINNWGFDNHSDNLNRLRGHQLPVLDQACSALLEDLHDRGLYESTLVIAMGEFGRTPRINPSAGRDHWPHVYSYLIGGAGIPGGTVIGASDAQGAYPASTPVTPSMHAATVFNLLGLDTAGKLREAGLVTDSRGIPGLPGEG